MSGYGDDPVLVSSGDEMELESNDQQKVTSDKTR